jgi:hypothetical protein
VEFADQLQRDAEEWNAREGGGCSDGLIFETVADLPIDNVA